MVELFAKPANFVDLRRCRIDCYFEMDRRPMQNIEAIQSSRQVASETS